MVCSFRNAPKKLVEFLDCQSAADGAEVLASIPDVKRRDIANFLKATLRNKKAKTFSLKEFRPQTEVVWEQKELNRVVDEFKEYISSQWEDGAYLKFD